MKTIVTNPDTTFGEVVTTFDNFEAAIDWIKICLQNKIKCVITTE